MNNMAAAGMTLLIEQPGALEIRDWLTTDPSNPLTSEPYVTTTADYISQQFRALLKPFNNRKMIASLPSSIQLVCNAALTSNVNNNLISGFLPVTVAQDAADPTQINVNVGWQPLFSDRYINVTFNVTLG
jgi:hypothetical protein